MIMEGRQYSEAASLFKHVKGLFMLAGPLIGKA